jgi:hypothetical protein
LIANNAISISANPTRIAADRNRTANKLRPIDGSCRGIAANPESIAAEQHRPVANPAPIALNACGRLLRGRMIGHREYAAELVGRLAEQRELFVALLYGIVAPRERIDERRQRSIALSEELVSHDECISSPKAGAIELSVT